MHPEIKKFFESFSGCTRVHFDGSVYFQFEDMTGYERGRLQEDGSIKYYYYGWRTEREMLKIIRLKAFI